MILKFFLNDTEIRAFFEGCGYKVEAQETGHFAPAYHNRSEWVSTEKLFVKAGTRNIPADKLLEETVKTRLLSTDLGSKLAVKKAIAQLKPTL